MNNMIDIEPTIVSWILSPIGLVVTVIVIIIAIVLALATIINT